MSKKRAARCPKCQAKMLIEPKAESFRIKCASCGLVLSVPASPVQPSAVTIENVVETTKLPAATKEPPKPPHFTEFQGYNVEESRRSVEKFIKSEWTPGKACATILGSFWLIVLLLLWSSEALLLILPIQKEELADHAPALVRIILQPFLALLVTVGFGLYLAPSGVAILRRHNNAIPVFLVNMFLGWTFLGWVGAFVWSFTDNAKPRSAN
jgi:ribosomal protein S27E